MVTVGPDRRTGSDHVPELDGLRAIAILLVVLFHSRTIARAGTGAERFYITVAEFGWIGVDLFFVLSGFLITRILIHTAGRDGYFRSFYTRRVLRIFPLYYAALAVYGITVHGFGIDRMAPPSAAAEAAHWLYLQNWLPLLKVEWTRPLAHFWSLGVEEQFYLFWPALVLVCARRGRVLHLCLGMIALAVAMRLGFWWAGESEAGNFATVTRLDTLGIGGCLACLEHDARSMRLRRPVVMAALVGSSAAMVAVALLGGGFYRPSNDYIFLFGLLPVAVFFGAVLAATLAAGQASRWRQLLRARPMTAIGRVSYGVYVVHWPLVLALQPAWQHVPGGFWVQQATFLAVIAAGSIALAALSYVVFERRFLNLKDKLAPRPGSPSHQHAPSGLN